jgi:hypothetical protein
VSIFFSTTGGSLASATNSCQGGTCSLTSDACATDADCPVTAGRAVPTNGNGAAEDFLTLGVADPTSVTVTAFSATLSNSVNVDRTTVGINQPPTAIAYPNPPGFDGECNLASPLCEQQVGSPVLFDGTDSFDPDSQITCYQWEITSSVFASNEIVQGVGVSSFNRIYTQEQAMTVLLRVSDDVAATAACNSPTPAASSLFQSSASFLYDIVCANDPPVADAGSNIATNLPVTGPPAFVTLDGSLSSDPDGLIDQYTWTCGSGNPPVVDPSNPARVTCQYDGVGTFTATLNVLDNGTGVIDPGTGTWECQRGSTDTTQVTVNPSP